MNPALFAYTHKIAQTPGYTPPAWRPSPTQLQAQLKAGVPDTSMEGKLKSWAGTARNFAKDPVGSFQVSEIGQGLMGNPHGYKIAPPTQGELDYTAEKRRVFGGDWAQTMPGATDIEGQVRRSADIAARDAEARIKQGVTQAGQSLLTRAGDAVTKAKPWLIGGGLGIAGLLAALAYGAMSPKQPQQLPQNMAMAGYGGWGQQLPPYDPRAYR
jgi:hypothetical protein